MVAALPSNLAKGDVASLIVYVRKTHFERGATMPEIRLGREPLSLTWASWRRSTKEHHFISGRVALGGTEPRVQIQLEGQRLRARDFRVELCRWQLEDQS